MKGTKFPDIDFERLIIPPAELKIVRRNGVYKVFDIIRKDYFILTEEEFVRQIFVAWMINILGYPASLLANEKGITLNETYKRCDTILFTPNGNPLMIVEYKAPSVNISQDVFNQIVRYNMALHAKYLVVSNGYKCFCCAVDYITHNIHFLNGMPAYNEIKE